MKYAFIIIALITTLLSCAKEDESIKIDALTTGTWKISGDMRDYGKDGVYEEDAYAIYDTCIKDNIYTFQADGNAIRDEGPVKCYESQPQTSTSSWNFSNHQNQLQWEGTNYQIEELTATTMRLQGKTSYNVIFTIDIKLIFTKQ